MKKTSKVLMLTSSIVIAVCVSVALLCLISPEWFLTWLSDFYKELTNEVITSVDGLSHDIAIYSLYISGAFSIFDIIFGSIFSFLDKLDTEDDEEESTSDSTDSDSIIKTKIQLGRVKKDKIEKESTMSLKAKIAAKKAAKAAKKLAEDATKSVETVVTDTAKSVEDTSNKVDSFINSLRKK